MAVKTQTLARLTGLQRCCTRAHRESYCLWGRNAVRNVGRRRRFFASLLAKKELDLSGEPKEKYLRRRASVLRFGGAKRDLCKNPVVVLAILMEPDAAKRYIILHCHHCHPLVFRKTHRTARRPGAEGRQVSPAAEFVAR